MSVLVDPNPNPNPKQERLHFLDWTRNLLILLGIPYHAALAFTPGDWIINMPVSWPPFAVLTEFVHAWRMPGFFFIAGLLSTWTIAKRPASSWLRLRAMRLGLPLLGGIVLVNVPMALILTALTRNPLVGVQATFAAGLTPLALVEHLWFLLVLLVFSGVQSGLVAAGRRLPMLTQRLPRLNTTRALDDQPDGHWGWRRLTAGLLVAVVITSTASAAWNLVPAGIAHEELTSNVGTHASFYIAGVLLAIVPDGLQRLVRTPVVPLACCVALLTVAYLAASSAPGAAASSALLRIALGWSAVTLLLRLAVLVGSRRNARIETIVAGAIIFYVFHQPALVFTDLALAHLSALPVLVFLISVASASAFATAMYAVIRRIRLLRLIFAGSSRPMPPVSDLLRRRDH